MRTIILAQHAFDDADALHDFLADKLGFPDYYGRNLDALNDCLGDICEPTLLVIDADHELSDHLESEGPTFFDKACRVMRRAAQENEDLSVMDAVEYENFLWQADSPEDL